MSDDEAQKSLKLTRMITAATNAKSKQIVPTTMSGTKKKINAYTAVITFDWSRIL